MPKTFWRCNVCNDIHYGLAGAGVCPTSSKAQAYFEITKGEAIKVMGLNK